MVFITCSRAVRGNKNKLTGIFLFAYLIICNCEYPFDGFEKQDKIKNSKQRSAYSESNLLLEAENHLHRNFVYRANIFAVEIHICILNRVANAGLG
ncbi:hypothetical protein BpHYR1_012222 [Brachionus plicatilis]|uniref:Uncharacterized protein n=1 Tax=Brachionus plicatilis TaxID=10195 RepID=A0A3M7P2P8_BRAPC|nr:hypothetical protein BpHYR1_012222 [Brachionus plicatilis]